MAKRLRQRDLTALARGYAFFGSGGGGSTAMLELLLADDEHWPIQIDEVSNVDPATPCMGVAFVGSTMLLTERLPGSDAFGPLVAAAERWLGHQIPAVCSLEGGGMNGLTPLLLAGSRRLVDADCTGRGVPGLDQMSLFVDRVPGLVFACDTGAGGVALVEARRAIDAERVVRSAIVQAGGVGCAVLAGFTVGDLHDHAIEGHLTRALALGSAFQEEASATVERLVGAIGATLLAEGRISSVHPYAHDPHVSVVEIAGNEGGVHRVITRSESLAVLTDGRLTAAAPTIITILDAVSREVVEVTALTPSRSVIVLGIPAPAWWRERPERLERIIPSAYGLHGLDAA